MRLINKNETKYDCDVAIRQLTPKEYFRLQGWSDDYFEKAAFVNSNSQLYKLNFTNRPEMA